jgi:hypothetical protein
MANPRNRPKTETEIDPLHPAGRRWSAESSIFFVPPMVAPVVLRSVSDRRRAGENAAALACCCLVTFFFADENFGGSSIHAWYRYCLLLLYLNNEEISLLLASVSLVIYDGWLASHDPRPASLVSQAWTPGSGCSARGWTPASCSIGKAPRSETHIHAMFSEGKENTIYNMHACQMTLL